MQAERVHDIPFNVPNPSHAVVAARGQPRAVGGPLEGGHVLVLVAEELAVVEGDGGGEAVGGGRAAHGPDAGGGVTGAGGD